MQKTKALDDVVAASAAEAQAAASALGNRKSSDPELARTIARIRIVGRLLDQPGPAATAPKSRPGAAKPSNSETAKPANAEAVHSAEQRVLAAVSSLSNEAEALGKQIDPKTAPPEVVQGYLAAKERIERATVALWAAAKLAPASSGEKPGVANLNAAANSPVPTAAPGTAPSAPQNEPLPPAATPPVPAESSAPAAVASAAPAETTSAS